MLTATVIAGYFRALDGVSFDLAYDTAIRNLIRRYHLPADEGNGRTFFYGPASAAAIRLAQASFRAGFPAKATEAMCRFLASAQPIKFPGKAGCRETRIAALVRRVEAGEDFELTITPVGSGDYSARVTPSADELADELADTGRPRRIAALKTAGLLVAPEADDVDDPGRARRVAALKAAGLFKEQPRMVLPASAIIADVLPAFASEEA